MSGEATLPRHRVVIRREALYADVELHVGGRLVAETSLARDCTRNSESTRDFVRAYFHRPNPQRRRA